MGGPNGVGVLAVSRDAIRNEIKSLSTKEVKAELTRLLAWSADNLVRLSIVVTELEERGEDLSSIRFSLLPMLRSIADGTLLPDIVVQYSGQPAMIKSIGKLPIEKQKRIASGKELPMKKTQDKPIISRGYVDHDEDDEPQPTTLSIQSIADKAGAKDIADMIVDMIMSSKDRQMVLKHLSSRLAEEGLKLST